MPPMLLVPGIHPTGPGHWLTLWEGTRGGRRVEVPQGLHSQRAEWLEVLEDAIAACEEPPLLVGHGLGALAIVHWAGDSDRTLRGALLVVPPDAERPEGTAVQRAFAPIPRYALPFPAVVAASETDPDMALDRLRSLAADWGARFVDVGACGRLDPASGHGAWPLGEALVQELL